jgi:hypothetical protein
MKSVLALVVAFMLVMGSTAIAALPAAAATISIGVTPSLLELTSNPGSTGSQDLTVSNQGDEAFDATTGITEMHGASATNSAASWLKVKPASIHVGPGQKQTVTVTINVPNDLASGGYYASITITTGAKKGSGSGAAIAGQLGVPFLFTITGSGKVSQKATIEKFAPVLESDGRIGFRALVQSSGNRYITAKGTVQVDQNGKSYGSLDFPSSTPILQGNDQLMQTQGSLPLQTGASYKASVSIDYGAKKPVTAEASFTMSAPAVAVANLAVCENLDKGPTLSATLQNSGDLGVLPTVTLDVKSADGNDLGNGPLPQPPLLWPKDSSSFAVDFPTRLTTGSYVFTVTVQLPNGQPATQELPFQIGGTGPTTAPLCSQTATPAATPDA